MVEQWLWSSWTEAWLVVVSAVVIVVVLVGAVRLVGLRSLSKMSTFDFAVTVALGSVLASVAASSTSLVNGAVAIGALLGTQFLIGFARQRMGLGRVVDNQPLLLMSEGRFHDAALLEARVTRGDVLSKLREANVLRLGDVRAVVLETAGDVSVLHGDGPVDGAVLEGVRTPDRGGFAGASKP